MEEVRHRQAARELVLKIVGFGIDHVLDAHHGGGGQCALVNGAEDHAVVMAIDQAWSNVQFRQVG